MRKIEKSGLGHLKKTEKKNRQLLAGREKTMLEHRPEHKARRRCG